jgi:hypothetical protein
VLLPHVIVPKMIGNVELIRSPAAAVASMGDWLVANVNRARHTQLNLLTASHCDRQIRCSWFCRSLSVLAADCRSPMVLRSAAPDSPAVTPEPPATFPPAVVLS